MDPDRLLKKADVCARTSLSYPTIWRKIRAGTFPKPVTISTDRNDHPSRIAWREREIVAWMEGLR